MTLVPYDANKIGCYHKKTKLLKILDEFRDSDYDCVKVENYDHKDAYSCTASLSCSIKRYHYDNIRAVTCRGEVFLVKVQP